MYRRNSVRTQHTSDHRNGPKRKFSYSKKPESVELPHLQKIIKGEDQPPPCSGSEIPDFLFHDPDPNPLSIISDPEH